MARQRPKTPKPPDSVRRAVERTVQSTLGSARSTRGRAQDLVDEATRIAEHGAARVGDLRFATRDDLRQLGERIDSLVERVDRLDGRGTATRRKPAAARRAGATKKTSAARKKPAASRKPAGAKRSSGRRTGGGSAKTS